ncbi:unnamed protein product [Ectocarpus sp. 13 AM-2016]
MRRCTALKRFVLGKKHKQPCYRYVGVMQAKLPTEKRHNQPCSPKVIILIKSSNCQRNLGAASPGDNALLLYDRKHTQTCMGRFAEGHTRQWLCHVETGRPDRLA